MKKNLLAFGTCAFALALGLVACGDDDSSNGPTNDHDGTDIFYQNPDVDYGTMTDARDGQVYKTVKIGTQTWMAENLNYDPGDVSGMGSDAWSGCYDNESANCSKYGRLYTWEVAMNDASCAYFHSCHPSGTVQGVCPSGWHLPSDTEWNTLWAAVGGTSTAGRKLKSTSGWYDGGNGTDSFGFAVLPAGGRHDRSFYYEGDYANFWSSTENNSRFADNWYFRYDLDDVRNYWNFKYYAFSVRCLRD